LGGLVTYAARARAHTHTPEVSIETFNEKFLLLFVENFEIGISIGGLSQLTYDVSLYILHQHHTVFYSLKPVPGTKSYGLINLSLAHELLFS